MKDARREIIKKAEDKIEAARIEAAETGQKLQRGWMNQVMKKAEIEADSHPDTSDGDEDELISEAELSECERLEKASTRVVGWYPRPYEKVIKGPFNRWFSIESTKNPIHVKDTASEEEDILFVANAMNMHSRLLAEIRRLRARKSQAAEIEKARELLERAKEIITNGETSLSGAMWMKDYYDCVATEELG